MAIGRMKQQGAVRTKIETSSRQELFARLFLALLLIGLPLGIWIVRQGDKAVTLRAVIPEEGGFLPDNLTAEVGVPLTLRLVSDDVLHSFALGQSDMPPVDIKPGQVTEVTLNFDEPGLYTYYCTHWCGPNHWRMRGTIEVTGEAVAETAVPEQPLYVSLELDIDAPHLAENVPDQTPDAEKGALLLTAVPHDYADRDTYLTQSPAAVWQSLRDEPGLAQNSDDQVWDLVAYLWQSQATDAQRQTGQQLYAQNCAACHGESGAGDGVFSGEIEEATDFTEIETMLGASTAVLDGKIRRGGMGTGMPYWGPIFTDNEIDSLIAYLWEFQFPKAN